MTNYVPGRFPPQYIRDWKVSDWRAWMYDHEVDEYDEMADRMFEIDTERRGLTDRMNRLRNRCIKRRKYDDSKGARAKLQSQERSDG